MGSGESKIPPGVPLKGLFQAWDNGKLPIQTGMSKKRAAALSVSWGIFLDDEGRQIWPQWGTFDYCRLKLLRSRLENLAPRQMDYWYCWAVLSDGICLSNPESQVSRPLPYNPALASPNREAFGTTENCESQLLAPLRTHFVPRGGNAGPVPRREHHPFSPGDIVLWQKSTPPFRAELQTVIKRIRTIVRSHNPSWADVNELLEALLTVDEKAAVGANCLKLENQNAPNGQQVVAWPRDDPDWDYNDPNHWQTFLVAKETLFRALEETGKKPINWEKFHAITQKSDETPDAFYVRLCDGAQLHAQLNAEDEKDLKAIAAAYVNQSATDIRDYFLKYCPGWSGKSMSEIRGIAMYVYEGRREKVIAKERKERKEDLKLLASSLQVNRSRGGFRGKGKGFKEHRGPTGPVSSNPPVCFYCKKPGHLKRDCRLRQRNEAAGIVPWASPQPPFYPPDGRAPERKFPSQLHATSVQNFPVTTNANESDCVADTVALLRRLADRGHKASPSKLQFCKAKVTYLGYVIGPGTRELSDERIQAILQIPLPKTKRQSFSTPLENRSLDADVTFG
ncbi:uncharacterized protein RBU57_008417 isoform 3-T6 [Macrochelys suwanniensis]